MPVHNYGTDLFVVSVNGRPISDWGEAVTPFSDDPIDPKGVLRRGQGGNAARLGRKNPGRMVTMFLQPGGADSAYMQGLMNSEANIALSAQQIGTLEAAIGAEGVITNDGPNGRGGDTITDDQYIIEFNVWTASKGGE